MLLSPRGRARLGSARRSARQRAVGLRRSAGASPSSVCRKMLRAIPHVDKEPINFPTARKKQIYQAEGELMPQLTPMSSLKGAYPSPLPACIMKCCISSTGFCFLVKYEIKYSRVFLDGISCSHPLFVLSVPLVNAHFISRSSTQLLVQRAVVGWAF